MPDWNAVLGRLGVFTDILATLCTYGSTDLCTFYREMGTFTGDLILMAAEIDVYI